ncbi:hypothetical protein P3X46_020200 [Hevea brasiliensis]|uniref:Uncharacterized protein n=1 Tax=Hevea brasiliensis TaxID=3981 RepID=A0ABQ9LL49_HEVBR|nr:hypothetical protein P3X46_020200 [Hevea brasiliensis]
MSCRLLIVSLLFASCFQEMLGARPLEGEKWVDNNLVIQSLWINVPPVGPSCNTHIPVPRGNKCTLSEMNVAGQVSHPPPPSPPSVFTEVAANLAVASINKETQKQDSSF